MVDWLRRWLYFDSNQRPSSWWRGLPLGELAAWARRAFLSPSVMARRRLGVLGVVRFDVEGRKFGSGCWGVDEGESMSGLAA